jgi:hypothetical protein
MFFLHPFLFFLLADSGAPWERHPEMNKEPKAPKIIRHRDVDSIPGGLGYNTFYSGN